MASLALYSAGCYFPMFSLQLVTIIHIFRYFLFCFFIFEIVEDAYIFYILLGMLGFIGRIELSLPFFIHKIFLGSPYLTLFRRLYFISSEG